MLEADKKLTLDDKVQKWLPDFKLYDPWVAKEATIRDLLCHRLGFETFQGDFMYFDSDLSIEEVRDKMGQLKPKYGFRSRWGYTNAAFMTAGEIIPKVTGRTWAQFITDSIFVAAEYEPFTCLIDSYFNCLKQGRRTYGCTWQAEKNCLWTAG
jgi:CubicO group peptidase (beta-lactamase class C family)